LQRLSELSAFDPKTGDLHVVIETPKGSRNKFKYDEKQHLFALSKTLAPGMYFPNDFGFVPSTRAEDGDPLDVLVLMDEPAFAGCLVQARLLGVIEAEQTDPGKRTTRNDRLIAVTRESQEHGRHESLADLPEETVAGIEHFFVSYQEMRNTQFKPLARQGPEKAAALVRKAERAYAKATA
jgi:inorganic pyrophosphatase